MLLVEMVLDNCDSDTKDDALCWVCDHGLLDEWASMITQLVNKSYYYGEYKKYYQSK